MDNEIFYVSESALQSAISDCFTFGIPSLLAWGNYQFLGNSGWFQFAIVVIFFMTALSKCSKNIKRFTSKKALLEYLNNQVT